MARQAYHITAGAPDADHIKVTPEAWYNVGAVQSATMSEQGSSNVGKVLSVNTLEEKASSVALLLPEQAAFEDEGRTLYAFGYEGQKFIADDGA